MQPFGSQFRWLVRGATLTAAMLALWWFALLTPMLGLLRVSSEFLLRLAPGGSATRISVRPDGDWNIAVPIGGAAKEALQQSVERALRKSTGPKLENQAVIRGINLRQSQQEIPIYTLGIPLYWAIILASPLSRRTWRALAAGTGITAALAPLSFVVHLAAPLNEFLRPGTSGAAHFALALGGYLSAAVIPYAAPVLVALALHPELRRAVFALAGDATPRKRSG